MVTLLGLCGRLAAGGTRGAGGVTGGLRALLRGHAIGASTTADTAHCPHHFADRGFVQSARVHGA